MRKISIQPILRTDTDTIEGTAIPVVFGKAKVTGKYLYVGNIQSSEDLSKLARYGDMVKAYLGTVWLALCMGKVSLESVKANDKTLEEGVDYWLDYFNDGTQEYKPRIPDMGMLVAVGNNGNKVYSKDGFTYTNIDTDSLRRNAVACHNGVWVAVGEDVCISTDAINWTSYALPGHELHAIMYDTWNNRWMAAGAYGEIWASTDAITWDLLNQETSDYTFYGLHYCNGYYYAVGGHTVDGTKVFQSVGGDEWDDITVPFGSGGSGGPGAHKCVTSNGFRLVVSNGPGTSVFYTDDDGASFTQVIAAGYNSIVWNGSAFIGVGGMIVSSSTDATSWTNKMGGANELYSVTYQDGMVIVAGANEIFISGDLSTWYQQYDGSMVFYGIAGIAGKLSNYATKLKGIAHIFFTTDLSTPEDMRIVFNSDGRAPKMDFVVENLLDSSPVENSTVEFDGTVYGANPAAVLYEVLTNKQWGCGIDSSKINLDSFNVASRLFGEHRLYGINTKIEGLVEARDIVNKIFDLTDLFLYVKEGTIYAGSFYSEETTIAAVISDEDHVTPVAVSKSVPESAPNSYEGEYTDPDLNFEAKTVSLINEACLSQSGVINKKKIGLELLSSPVPACQRLNEVMQRVSQGALSIQTTLSFAKYGIVPGDLVYFTSTEYGLALYTRAGSVSFPEDGGASMNVELVQAYEDLYDKNYLTTISARGTIPQKIS